MFYVCSHKGKNFCQKYKAHILKYEQYILKYMARNFHKVPYVFFRFGMSSF